MPARNCGYPVQAADAVQRLVRITQGYHAGIALRGRRLSSGFAETRV
jgi:hypothetical protein